MARKRVLLINPKTVNRYYHRSHGPLDRAFSWFFTRRYERRFAVPAHSYTTSMPPVTLYGVAALLSPRCDVQVVDEQVEPIDFDQPADLVGLTATTPQIPRAWAIAREFRARGVPTAIGGVHATCLPDECAEHCDVVCVGEAEDYANELLEDLERGRLRRRYENHAPVAMADVPYYQYDIGGGRYLPFHVLSYSRGCAFNCDFCSIRASLGTYRTRAVQSVVERIRAVGSRNLWFTDATLTAQPQQARELFEALVPLKIRWLGQITLNIAHDEAMLDLLARSGCWLAGIGFETLSNANLRTAHKAQNRVEDYARIIRALHARKIAIDGNFVFGFDEDREDVFDATANFALETGIDFPDFYVLTPYPDTALYQRLRADGRIVDADWSHYDNAHFTHLPVFTPKHMSREALRDGCRRAERRVYSFSGTLRRLMTARVFHGPVWVANIIYARRLAQRGDLIPAGDGLAGSPAAVLGRRMP